MSVSRRTLARDAATRSPPPSPPAGPGCVTLTPSHSESNVLAELKDVCKRDLNLKRRAQACDHITVTKPVGP